MKSSSATSIFSSSILAKAVLVAYQRANSSSRQTCMLLWLALCLTSLQPGLAQEPLRGDTSELAPLIQNPQQFAQPLRQPTFEFKAKKDIPILVGSAAMVVSGFVLKAKVPVLTEAEIAALDPNSINAFDRGAMRQVRALDSNLSDYLLMFSAVSPLSVMASRSVRPEATAVAVMYFETAALTGGLINLSKGLFKRKRPYVYNPDVPLFDKQKVRARHSFFSGHVAASSSFMYLTAFMVDRYADRPVWKWVAWSGAVVVPGTVAVWRYTSGKHFPTDVIAGYLVGAGTGLLIPWIHRRQLPKDMTLNVQPTPYGMHLSLTF